MNFLITLYSDESYVHAAQRKVDSSFWVAVISLYKDGSAFQDGFTWVRILDARTLITYCEYRRDSSITSDPNWSLERHPWEKLVSVPQRPARWNACHKITKIMTMIKGVIAPLSLCRPSTYGKMYRASPLGRERGYIHLSWQIGKEGQGWLAEMKKRILERHMLT